MSVPKVFKLINIDENDDRYRSLKSLFLNELKMNVQCLETEMETIANYIFEVLKKPNLTYESYNEEFVELFDKKSTFFQELLAKHAEKLYAEKDKDLLDEYKEEKERKYKESNLDKSGRPFRDRNNRSQDYQIGFKGAKPFSRGDQSEFNIGGKKIVLKNKKYDDSTQEVHHQRDRSRDEEYKPSYRDQQGGYQKPNFIVPQGVIRGNFASGFQRPIRPPRREMQPQQEVAE